MPLPLTPRRTSNRKAGTPAKKASLDVGKSAGQCDNATVLERIQQWQAQGGGVVTAADAIDTLSESDAAEHQEPVAWQKKEYKTMPPKPKTPRKRTEIPEPRTSDTHRRRSRRETPDDDADDARRHARSISAPRKRILSDGHWRKERSSAGVSTPKPEHTSSRPSWTLPDDGIRVRPITESALDIESNKQHLSLPRRSRHVPEEHTRAYSPAISEAGEDVSDAEPEPAPSVDKLSDRTLNFHSPTPSMRDDGDDHSNDDRSLTFGPADDIANLSKMRQPRHDSRRQRRPTQDHTYKMPRTLRDNKGGKRKTSKTGILGQVVSESKKIFAKAEPTPPTAPRVPTIESWLNGTPDPFVDEGPPSNEVPPPPAELQDTILQEQVTPVSSHRRNRERADKAQRTASHEIRETPDKDEPRTLERSSAKRQRPRVSTHTFEPTSQEEELPAQELITRKQRAEGEVGERVQEGTASSTLRRTGARRKSTAIPADWRNETPPRQGSATSNRDGAGHAIAGGMSPTTNPIAHIAPLRPWKTSERDSPRSPDRRPLSTIASVDTLVSGNKVLHERDDPLSSQNALPKVSEQAEHASELRDEVDLNGLDRRTSKSRITKHTDLMSVLSMPRGDGGRSIRSARSARSTRSRLDNATLPDLMKELAADEDKYLRELRTLVDGVIPVLLTSILSKADSAAAIRLFSSRRKANDPTATQPIYDMGIALERLKRAHKRIPLEHAEAFIVWARGTENAYRDYLKAWRMGFQDVIVNLAPAEGNKSNPQETQSAMDAGLPRNENGDVLGNEGERVDVAFLLKRPLVRLKYLSKTIRGINFTKPSAETELLNTKYQALVDEARDRANEERARLEDEAAADIDPTKARELRTLAPIEGVVINDTRRVRARDCFNLTLVHSSGQTVDCRVEMVLREDHDGEEHGGDVLICEIDGTGRWLLFPPVHTSCISARNGDAKGEIVVMLRGSDSESNEWHELLILHSDEEESGFEWVQMLGLVPIPPRITRSLSFIERRRTDRNYALQAPDSGYASSQTEGTAAGKSRIATLPEIEVPLGEARRNSKTSTGPLLGNDPLVPAVPSGLRARLQKRQMQSAASSAQVDSRGEATVGPSPDQIDSLSRRAKARDRHRRKTMSGLLDHPTADGNARSRGLDSETDHIGHRRQASAPPEELPQSARLTPGTPPLTPSNQQQDDYTWRSPESSPRTSKRLSKRRPDTGEDAALASPTHRGGSPIDNGMTVLNPPDSSGRRHGRSSPLKYQYDLSTASDSSSESDTSSLLRDVSSMSDTDDEADLEDGDVAMPLLPPGALHKFKKSSVQSGTYAKAPGTIGPSESASQAPYKSVPLQLHKQAKTIASIFYWSDKGSWEPLHPDECSINVSPGLIEAFEMSALHSQGGHLATVPEESSNLASSSPSTSRSSSTTTPRPLVGLELTPLVPIRRGTALDISIRSPPIPDSRLTSLPRNAHVLFRSRNAEECEALYALINHARINNPTYIALQHARATAYTKPFGGASFNSATGGGSRPGGRGNWFGLGRSRGSYRASSTPTPRASDPSVSAGSVASAFSALRRFGLRSERFSIARSTITSRQGSRADESVFSASDRSSSSGTSTPLQPGAVGNTGPPGMPTGGAGPEGIAPVGETVGLSNAKIRLYLRESASKWRDLGGARLTVMRPGSEAAEGAISGAGESDAGAASTGVAATAAAATAAAAAVSAAVAAPASTTLRAPGAPRPVQSSDRRVVVVSAKKGDTLLDVTLGESCFERVARTGIAVSVWETVDDGKRIGKQGGVVAGRLKVYMVQMGSEAEAAYTFGIVGRMRY